MIPLVNDDVMEAEEEFFLSLQLADDAIGAALTFPKTTGITITDDDGVSQIFTTLNFLDNVGFRLTAPITLHLSLK